MRFLPGDVDEYWRVRTAWEEALPGRLYGRLDRTLPESKLPWERMQQSFMRERDWVGNATAIRWDLLGPVGPPCVRMERFGQKEYSARVWDDPRSHTLRALAPPRPTRVCGELSLLTVPLLAL